ncbi:hypothetical protein [Brevundimonas diminuta]|uniref:hypothetical protein n=1 Tax=Brevundimonas diminuta TaxID=293 RepID=UPI003D9A7226
MTNISRLAAALFITAIVTACSGRVPSDGFKDLSYGMSLDELRSKGFNCQSDEYFCQPDSGAGKRYTLFGKEASVAVRTSDGRLVSINVRVDLSSDELISLYAKEFGDPKTFTYRSFGGQSERHYWHAGDRGAISVTRSLTRGDPSSLGVTFTSADYLGPEKTQELLEEASGNTVQAGDY